MRETHYGMGCLMNYATRVALWNELSNELRNQSNLIDFKSLTGMAAHSGVVPGDVCIYGKKKKLYRAFALMLQLMHRAYSKLNFCLVKFKL